MLPVALLTGSCHCPRGIKLKGEFRLKAKGQGPRAKPPFSVQVSLIYTRHYSGLCCVFVVFWSSGYSTFTWYGDTHCISVPSDLGHICFSCLTSVSLSSLRPPCAVRAGLSTHPRPAMFLMNSEDALHTVSEVTGSGFDVASLSDNFVLRKYTVFHGVLPLGEGFLPPLSNTTVWQWIQTAARSWPLRSLFWSHGHLAVIVMTGFVFLLVCQIGESSLFSLRRTVTSVRLHLGALFSVQCSNPVFQWTSNILPTTVLPSPTCSSPTKAI